MNTAWAWVLAALMAFSFLALSVVLIFVSNERDEARKEAEKLRRDQLEMAKLKIFLDTGRRP